MSFRKNFLLTAASVALLGASGMASAVPQLQLGIDGGTYDWGTQTIIAPNDSFTLYAFLTPQGGCDATCVTNLLADTYYISAALVGPDGRVSSSGTFGSFSFGGTTVNVTGDMVYGTPPLETVLGEQGFDPGDLSFHGIFDTFFKQTSFQFSSTNQAAILNTQDDPALNGLDTTGTGMYWFSISVDTSLLADGYQIHFDLYSSAIITCKNNPNCVPGDIDVNDFAPFSHDAQSGSSSSSGTSTTGDVPEPNSSSLALLGLAMLGTAFGMRRRKLNG